MNSVNITGRMTREPDIRQATGNNTAVAKFCIAVNRRFKQDGQPSADYINCTAFGKLAEFVEKYGRKGVKFEISGRWQTGSYKNKDGNTVYINDCNISKLEFCESKNSSGSSAEPQPKPDDSFMSIPSGIDEELPFT